MKRFNLAAFTVIVLLATALLGQSNPVPFVSQPLVPTSVAPGSPAFTLTVNGTGFVPDSAVNWNGVALTTTFVSNLRLTATVPAAKIVTASTASIMVVNPGPGGGSSNVGLLQVVASHPALGFFRSDLSLNSTSQSISVAVADFNRDGKMDLAAANGNLPGTVSILLGNGDGTFQPAVFYAAGLESISVATGDFNGDGIIDLVVANIGDSTVSILLGNGDGTFQPHLDYASGTEPSSVMCGDFNNDGKLDIVVANYGGASISILLGNGDGTFQPHVDYSDTRTNPFALNIGDFNGDGKLDVALATDIDATNGVAIYLGNGDGTFQPPVAYGAACCSISVEVADFNSDGKPDLAVGTSAGVSILLGNGDGTFQPHTDYATTTRVFGVRSGDFNGDGEVDLAVTNLDTNQVSVLLGNGDGTFQDPVDWATLVSPYSLAIGDFNSDGSLDLAIGYESGGATSVLLQSAVNLSASSLTFGTQTVRTTSNGQSVTLTNSGSTTLTIGGVKAAGNFSQSNSCGGSVAVGASCTITVTFTPTKKGVQTGTITIRDSANPNTQTITLTGSGTVVSLSPKSLVFPPEKVGVTSPSLTVTLTNVGTPTLNFYGSSIAGQNRRDFSQTSSCGFTVGGGQSCTVKVKFTPSAKGPRGALLEFYDDGGGSPQTVSLSGTGQ